MERKDVPAQEVLGVVAGAHSRSTALSLAELRESYARAGLLEEDVDPDPFTQFAKWFAEACAAGLREPNAMTLATASADGMPSARVVLLKAVDASGMVFYTNYDSRKGRELRENPRAAATFYWAELERQVRIEGAVERTSREESEAYFHSRPHGSQLGALVSQQSQVIGGRMVLESALLKLEAKYARTAVPLPPTWGGYRLMPHSIEFWQGRPNRLHDRLRYRKEPDASWVIERLSP